MQGDTSTLKAAHSSRLHHGGHVHGEGRRVLAWPPPACRAEGQEESGQGSSASYLTLGSSPVSAQEQ